MTGIHNLVLSIFTSKQALMPQILKLPNMDDLNSNWLLGLEQPAEDLRLGSITTLLTRT